MRAGDRASLVYNEENCRYCTVIGTGGIGSGMFFALEGNHTLGREESRGGRLLDRRDYCKLHIVLHYVSTLMGVRCRTIALGMVGDDEAGRTLLHEMKVAGIDIRFVGHIEGVHTLFSFCFVYPDGSGGNMTTSDSASALVTPRFIDRAASYFKKNKNIGIALALPEVPIESRMRVLEYGTEYSLFRVASFTTGEMEDVKTRGLFKNIDLLALNRNEAARIVGVSDDDASARTIAEKAVETLSTLYPDLVITITAGKRGNWAWDGKRLTYREAVPVEVVGTAGAGDAFLAGIITGLAVGLNVSEAQELASLIASLSVTSPHTIHKGIDRAAILDCARVHRVDLSARVLDVLTVDHNENTGHTM